MIGKVSFGQQYCPPKAGDRRPKFERRLTFIAAQNEPECILAIAFTRIGGLSSAALTRTRKHVTFDEFFVSGKHHVARAALAAKARLIHPVERDPDLAAFQDIPDVAGLRRFLDTDPAPWHGAGTAGGSPGSFCPD